VGCQNPQGFVTGTSSVDSACGLSPNVTSIPVTGAPGSPSHTPLPIQPTSVSVSGKCYEKDAGYGTGSCSGIENNSCHHRENPPGQTIIPTTDSNYGKWFRCVGGKWMGPCGSELECNGTSVPSITPGALPSPSSPPAVNAVTACASKTEDGFYRINNICYECIGNDSHVVTDVLCGPSTYCINAYTSRGITQSPSGECYLCWDEKYGESYGYLTDSKNCVGTNTFNECMGFSGRHLINGTCYFCYGSMDATSRNGYIINSYYCSNYKNEEIDNSNLSLEDKVTGTIEIKSENGKFDFDGVGVNLICNDGQKNIRNHNSEDYPVYVNLDKFSISGNTASVDYSLSQDYIIFAKESLTKGYTCFVYARLYYKNNDKYSDPIVLLPSVCWGTITKSDAGDLSRCSLTKFPVKASFAAALNSKGELVLSFDYSNTGFSQVIDKLLKGEFSVSDMVDFIFQLKRRPGVQIQYCDPTKGECTPTYN